MALRSDRSFLLLWTSQIPRSGDHEESSISKDKATSGHMLRFRLEVVTSHVGSLEIGRPSSDRRIGSALRNTNRLPLEHFMLRTDWCFEVNQKQLAMVEAERHRDSRINKWMMLRVVLSMFPLLLAPHAAAEIADAR